MTWNELTPMARIEVVVQGDVIPHVRDVLLASGARGYTVLSGVSGFGHNGPHEGRLVFNDRHSLSMLICVMPAERVDDVVAGVRRLLDDNHGVMFVTETHVSRPDYFT